jgi:hypothetical protein
MHVCEVLVSAPAAQTLACKAPAITTVLLTHAPLLLASCGITKHHRPATLYGAACREAAGTNLGNIREQPPTGKRVEFAGISLISFNEAGQIETTMVFRYIHTAGQAAHWVQVASGTHG